MINMNVSSQGTKPENHMGKQEVLLLEPTSLFSLILVSLPDKLHPRLV